LNKKIKPLSTPFNRGLDQEVCTNPEDILKMLLESQSKQTVIGIISPVFGRVMVMTCVDTLVLEEESPVVVFKPFDIYGCMLPTNKVELEYITSVCAFSSEFKNPLETKLGDDQKTMRN
jgi:hypothetical protein